MKRIIISIVSGAALIALIVGVLSVAASKPEGNIMETGYLLDETSDYPSALSSKSATKYEYGTIKTPIGEHLTFTITATDSDNDSLIYSATNLPEGASFDPDTRTFSWTPRYDQAGVYSVHFEVSDGQLTDSEDVTITVVQPSEDWDINGDDATNVLDMVLIGQHWGESGLTGWIREDANEDGTINVLDMILIGQHWNMQEV
jgi:hypothetical protein